MPAVRRAPPGLAAQPFWLSGIVRLLKDMGWESPNSTRQAEWTNAMMNYGEQYLDRVRSLNVCRRDQRRAPHKPLFYLRVSRINITSWWKSTYNAIALVRDLIVPIMEDVQKYGLKTRNLGKFMKTVDKFYQDVITDQNYKSDLVTKYQKRFIRYRESLFTFLKEDGIPWHNNTAERAIRHIAKQRAISSNFSSSVVDSYLVLLGIKQTCRFQGKSFFKFLFSKEKNTDSFKSPKRRV